MQPEPRSLFERLRRFVDFEWNGRRQVDWWWEDIEFRLLRPPDGMPCGYGGIVNGEPMCSAVPTTLVFSLRWHTHLKGPLYVVSCAEHIDEQRQGCAVSYPVYYPLFVEQQGHAESGYGLLLDGG